VSNNKNKGNRVLFAVVILLILLVGGCLEGEVRQMSLQMSTQKTRFEELERQFGEARKRSEIGDIAISNRMDSVSYKVSKLEGKRVQKPIPIPLEPERAKFGPAMTAKREQYKRQTLSDLQRKVAPPAIGLFGIVLSAFKAFMTAPVI
jgi:outer membrane murein-binding lipoprotein Lpp